LQFVAVATKRQELMHETIVVEAVWRRTRKKTMIWDIYEEKKNHLCREEPFVEALWRG
jgi:hypothetical protein